MVQEANLLTNLLGKIIPRNLIMGTEKMAQVSLPTEIGGSIKLSVGISNPFSIHTANRTELTIKTTIIYPNQATVTGHIDQDYLTLGSLDNGTSDNIPHRGT